MNNLIAAILLTHTTFEVPGGTSPVVAVSHAGRAVGGSVATRLQGPGQAASITRLGTWKSKCRGSEEDAREEGDYNHAEHAQWDTERSWKIHPRIAAHFINNNGS